MDVQNSTLFNFAQSFGFSSVPDSQPPHLADSFRKAKEMNADFILSEISTDQMTLDRPTMSRKTFLNFVTPTNWQVGETVARTAGLKSPIVGQLDRDGTVWNCG